MNDTMTTDSGNIFEDVCFPPDVAATMLAQAKQATEKEKTLKEKLQAETSKKERRNRWTQIIAPEADSALPFAHPLVGLQKCIIKNSKSVLLVLANLYY